MTNSIPTLRAEKTSRNQDDLRVMISGSLFCIFLILVQPLAFKAYDYLLAERPFVSATVELVHVEGRTQPMIRYDADATQDVEGIWIATIYSQAEGEYVRVATRRGDGAYNTQQDEPVLWSWAAWFDNERDGATPQVPRSKFMVCVRYVVEASDSHVHDDTPKFCSDLYDPLNPGNTLALTDERTIELEID